MGLYGGGGRVKEGRTLKGKLVQFAPERGTTSWSEFTLLGHPHITSYWRGRGQSNMMKYDGGGGGRG